jgi:hypothetical protein
MKLKALVMTAAVAGAAASIAAAAPPPGKGSGLALGTPMSTAAENRGPREGHPVVMLVLRGEFGSGSADATGAGSFTMLVNHANRHARALRGKEVTVKVDGRTTFRRQGPAELSDLKEDDRLVVHARASKRADAASVELLARRVIARPAAEPAPPAGP